jgi:threonine aldolase
MIGHVQATRPAAPAAGGAAGVEVDVDAAVFFQGDGERRSPGATIRRLVAFEAGHGIRPDSYSLGGVVEEMESALARALGKEAALFLPTGTLANLLAITRHCGTRGQAILPAESHVYRDTGDGVARLGGLQMIPLAPGRPGPTAEEVRAALDRPGADRVYDPAGVVMLESPVRRQMGRVIPFAAMQAITALCRARGVPTHLDGARLYMMSAATGVSVREYSALFDTVYVSVSKYLGAPFGAVLAGSRSFVDGLYHERRMHGGSLPGAWMGAALVLEGMEGFEARFGAAMAQARRLFEDLNRLEGLHVAPLPDGSNVFPLRLGAGLRATALSVALRRRGIVLPAEGGTEEVVPLAVNTTIARRTNDALLAAFADAVGDSSESPDRHRTAIRYGRLSLDDRPAAGP